MTLSSSQRMDSAGGRGRKALRRAGTAAAALGLSLGMITAGASPALAGAEGYWIIEGSENFTASGGAKGASVEVEGNVPYGVLKFEVEGDGLKVDSTYAHFRPFNPFLSVSSWRLDFSFAQFDPETGDYYEVARSDDSWHGATGALSIGRYGPGFEFPEGKEGLACVTFTWKSGHGTLQETHCHKVKPSGGGLFGLF